MVMIHTRYIASLQLKKPGAKYIVHEYMCEGILEHDQLQELIRFRTNIAHQVKYADMETGAASERV